MSRGVHSSQIVYIGISLTCTDTKMEEEKEQVVCDVNDAIEIADGASHFFITSFVFIFVAKIQSHGNTIYSQSLLSKITSHFLLKQCLYGVTGGLDTRNRDASRVRNQCSRYCKVEGSGDSNDKGNMSNHDLDWCYDFFLFFVLWIIYNTNFPWSFI